MSPGTEHQDFAFQITTLHFLQGRAKASGLAHSTGSVPQKYSWGEPAKKTPNNQPYCPSFCPGQELDFRHQLLGELGREEATQHICARSGREVDSPGSGLPRQWTPQVSELPTLLCCLPTASQCTGREVVGFATFFRVGSTSLTQ